METLTAILIVLFLLLIIIVFTSHFTKVPIEIGAREIMYYSNAIINFSINGLKDNNRVDRPSSKRHRICFITLENRVDLDYVQLHNQNLHLYCKKYNIDYVFHSQTDKNIYWAKMYLLREYLPSYDYVVWLDSDTIIANAEFDIHALFNQYDSDIFIGKDYPMTILNAGVIMVRNSEQGMSFLNDCIQEHEKTFQDCVVDQYHLNGVWAGVCYEQGTIHIMIGNKYSKYTTLLDEEQFYNFMCTSHLNRTIIHLCGASSSERKEKFEKIMAKEEWKSF